jgi:hypothetical protein
MNAVRKEAVLIRDGEVSVAGLPFKKGQHVELLVIAQDPPEPERKRLTAQGLRKSGLVGIWRNRKDLPDSAAFARQLRDNAQKRWG